jgi:hypothetical protein
MSAFFRSLALCALLIAALIGVAPDGVAADTPVLNIDANQHVTTGPIFAPYDTIVFWFNSPDGGAGPFVTDYTGTFTARADGSVDATISSLDWARLPFSTTSIVAYGKASGVSAVHIIAPASNFDLTMKIDANHHATTAQVFARNDRIVFWYNLADGSAQTFYPNGDGFLLAGANGAFDYTFSAEQWATIPAAATSLVAHGVFSQLSVVAIFPR